MKNFIELIKKYKVYILAVLLVIFFFRSCTKSTSARKAEKVIVEKEVVIDSLENVIKLREQKIDSFPEILRQEKLTIHMEYDNYISEKDRGEQLMELHMMVKDNIKDLQK
jgi:PBP1b-binding outer membrane lipoprotein LpoB